MTDKLKRYAILSIVSLALASCDTSTVDPVDPADPNQVDGLKVISSNITSNTTWYSDTIYQLGSRVSVTSGVTLIIEAGTVIKGEAGSGSNATALVISRGAKIMARGTVSAPIVFTSVADELSPENIASGNFASPNLEPTVNGLWGGLIILGNAKISASNTTGDVSEVQIEGIPTSDSNGLYGGTDDMDNSGEIKYVSIRHGGANIGSGNEINGLTMGGVGSGTLIQNVEVVANQDDGFECFGGTVNLNNIVSWNVGDDGFDTDQSWAGTLDNFIIISPDGHCFELDGPEGNYKASHTIKNGHVIANGDNQSGDLINIDDNSRVSLQDIYFMDVLPGQQINRVTASDVSYSGIVLDVDTVDKYVNGTVPAGITAGQTPKADINVFSWTWAQSAGIIK